MTLLGRPFLRKFATTFLLADAVGPWGQGARAFALLLLGPKMRVGLDGRLIASVARALRPSERPRLLAIGLEELGGGPAIALLRFIGASISARGQPIPNWAVELFAERVIRLAGRHPSAIGQLDRRGVAAILDSAPPGRRRRNVFSLCLRLVLDLDADAALAALMKMADDRRIIDVIADTLCIQFGTKTKVLEGLRADKRGRAVLARASYFQNAWKRAGRREVASRAARPSAGRPASRR